jgi:hypothetical protein
LDVGVGEGKRVSWESSIPSAVIHPVLSIIQFYQPSTSAQIARNKVGDMDKNRVDIIVVQFAAIFDELKPLLVARDLRNALFPIRDGAIFTGTFRDHNIMYDRMINAFSRAIGRLGKEEQATA